METYFFQGGHFKKKISENQLKILLEMEVNGAN